MTVCLIVSLWKHRDVSAHSGNFYRDKQGILKNWGRFGTGGGENWDILVFFREQFPAGIV